MKTTMLSTNWTWAPLLALAGVLALLPLSGAAQMAITEVMTSASTSPDTGQNPDYFEVTNLGTNNVLLTACAWSDGKGTRMTTCFQGVVVSPGESVVFFRQKNLTTPTAFRAWWGLSTNVQVIGWGTSPGLSSDTEEVTLWDADGRELDRVQLGKAATGVSFTYDPLTGWFGTFSAVGVDGGFRSNSGDVGSPGTTAGPVQPYWIQQPVSAEVSQCQDATFRAVATGRPQPRWKWYRQGAVLAGATTSVLTISNAQPADAGVYRAVAWSEVGAVTSAVAVLNVRTDPAAPSLAQPLESVVAFAGQTVNLTVVARGYPCMGYQWRENGIILPGEVGPTLTLRQVSLARSGTWYSVEVFNAFGSINASAQLSVLPRPVLRFTEVMPYVATNCGAFSIGADWFEITNDDTNAVSLRGWKVFDADSLEMAFVIQPDLVLQPGQSAVFVQRMTRADFIAWWGAENLPPGLPILSFTGFSLSKNGEPLFLWYPGATDPDEAVAAVAWWEALPGVSMYFPVSSDWIPTDSVPGVDGAFTATRCADVGSPGYAPGRAAGLAPEIVNQPTSRAVLQGRQVAFEAAATGGGPWHCQWLGNDAELPGETGANLSVDTSELRAAGLYQFTATTPYGAVASRVAALSVFAYGRTPAGTSEFTIWGPGREQYRLEVAASLSGMVVWQPIQTNTGLVPLNTACVSALLRLPGVSASLAQAIVASRAGADGLDGTADDVPFGTVAELQRVPGMTTSILAGLAPYATTDSASLVLTVNDAGHSQRFYRLVPLGEAP